jgi:hypothetical protein
VALLLRPLKLSGLAMVAGFAAAIYLIAGFEFTPLTTTRKIILVCLFAPLGGIALDLLVKRTRSAALLAGLAAAAVTPWVFLTILKQKDGAALWMLAAGTTLFCAWLAGFMVALRDDALRSGAATLALGVGVGVVAVLGASALFGQYGIALGAAGGAFLLALVIAGPKSPAGAVLGLTTAMIAGLFAGGTLVLASLPWTSLLALALVPLTVRLPLPEKLPTWIKAAVASVYAIAPAGAACFLAWQAASASST